MSNIRPISDPSLTAAMVETFQSIDRRNHAITAIAEANRQLLVGQVVIGLDLSNCPDLIVEVTGRYRPDGGIEIIKVQLPLEPADVPACMRADCTPPERPVPTSEAGQEINRHGRGSAAAARPFQRDIHLDRVAPDHAPRTTEEVAGSNPAPGQPTKRRVAELTPEVVASLRAAIPARQAPQQSVSPELNWSERDHEMRDDAWQKNARTASAMLLDALRRHHPERCGGL